MLSPQGDSEFDGSFHMQANTLEFASLNADWSSGMSIRNQLLLPARRLRNVAFRFSLVLLTVVPLVALASERGQGAAAGIKIPCNYSPPSS